jgi:hypothetical protein
MAQNQQKDFDIHDPNAILTKMGQLRMALRQLDDKMGQLRMALRQLDNDLTGLIYIAVNQLQNEQRERAQKEAMEKSKVKDIEKTGK